MVHKKVVQFCVNANKNLSVCYLKNSKCVNVILT